MDFKILQIAALACGVLGVLTGCSNVKETLGMNRHSPDEFAVVKRAPLSMPPDYSLRPPRPGAPRPQEQAPSAQAAQTVLGVDNRGQSAPGTAEQILLEQAGAADASPAIRQVVDQESITADKADKPVVDKLLDFRGNDKPTAVVVDAEKELERLKDNQQEGKPVTEGETPSVED